MKKLGAFLEQFGNRLAKLGYLLGNPAYGRMRRSGGAPDLYRLLNKPWLPATTIGTVLDVGANEGQFVRLARELLPEATIFAFEPNPKFERALQEQLSPARGDAVFRIACGRERDTMPLHVPEFAAASSLLEAGEVDLPDFPDLREKESITVAVEPLDEVLARQPGPRTPYLLKLDVQGYELEVLRGAPQTLRETAVVICEINVASFYRGQATLDALYALLREQEFRLVDLGDPIRAGGSGEILYFDAVFMR